MGVDPSRRDLHFASELAAFPSESGEACYGHAHVQSPYQTLPNPTKRYQREGHDVEAPILVTLFHRWNGVGS
jgi:hypothetical protein